MYVSYILQHVQTKVGLYYITQMQYEGSEELTTVKHIKNNILTWRQHVNQTEHRKASLDWRLISQGCCNGNSHRLNTNLEDHALKPSGTSRVPTFQHRAIRNDPSDVSNLWGACTNHLPPRHRFAPWRWSWPTFRRSIEHALGMWVSLWNSKKDPLGKSYKTKTAR